MTCRHLIIQFLESGDVKYDFFRHNGKTNLHRYLIEWPASQVEIVGKQCFETHGFRRSVTSQGFLLLEWDKATEGDSGGEVAYLKRGYLARLRDEPNASTTTSVDSGLWRYSERFRIKPDFKIALHSPFERLNAVRRRSSAVFRSVDGTTRHYRPRDLSQGVFRTGGVLTVDWVLELLEEARRAW